MTTGIQVRWPDPDADGKLFEIEYFCGIDVNRLDHVPEFTTVPAIWPHYERGTPVVYAVEARCERHVPGEVRLVVVYDSEMNPELAEFGIYWGTNTIILRQGELSGTCAWVRDGTDSAEEISWEAFDIGAGCARPRSTNRGSRREAWFRSVILECDAKCCVLTGEAPVQALEAAHLIPAANGQNDVPSNGITLRADLHRLFDAGVFTFTADGRVAVLDPQLCQEYRRLLRKRHLPPSTLERVGATLAHPQFQCRPHAR